LFDQQPPEPDAEPVVALLEFGDVCKSAEACDEFVAGAGLSVT
jgi:hypothetical protein